AVGGVEPVDVDIAEHGGARQRDRGDAGRDRGLVGGQALNDRIADRQLADRARIAGVRRLADRSDDRVLDDQLLDLAANLQGDIGYWRPDQRIDPGAFAARVQRGALYRHPVENPVDDDAGLDRHAFAVLAGEVL